MATLQQTIAERFLNKLAESKEVSADKVDQLRTLLAENKKLKPEELVRIFSLPSGDLAIVANIATLAEIASPGARAEALAESTTPKWTAVGVI